MCPTYLPSSLVCSACTLHRLYSEVLWIILFSTCVHTRPFLDSDGSTVDEVTLLTSRVSSHLVLYTSIRFKYPAQHRYDKKYTDLVLPCCSAVVYSTVQYQDVFRVLSYRLYYVATFSQTVHTYNESWSPTQSGVKKVYIWPQVWPIE